MNKIRLSTRDAIIEAAFAVFNETPAASLGDIAERAGVGRATLHRHFRARDDLMIALAHTAIDELDDAATKATLDAPSYTEALRLMLVAIIPLASRQWFLSHETINDPALNARLAKDAQDLHHMIDAARREGSIAEDLPTKWVSEVFENLIYAAWTMVRADEATAKQAAELAWRSFLKGVS